MQLRENYFLDITQGFVSDRLNILDTTHMGAKVERFRGKQEHANQDEDDDHTYRLRLP